MSANTEIVCECLDRIAAKYARRGKEELWDDATRKEFLRAFALVPIVKLPCVVDEVLLNPPVDDRGRVMNWLPEPEDIVRVARSMTEESGVSPSQIVAEILEKIARFGPNGVRDPDRRHFYTEGPPPLSPLAAQTVRAMGGWRHLCQMSSPDGVTDSLLLNHAKNAVHQERRQPLLTERKTGLLPMQQVRHLLEEGRPSAFLAENAPKVGAEW
jgi:hypothetical protein